MMSLNWLPHLNISAVRTGKQLVFDWILTDNWKITEKITGSFAYL